MKSNNGLRKMSKNYALRKLSYKISLALALGSIYMAPAYALPNQGDFNNSAVADIGVTGNVMEVAGKGNNNVLNWQDFSIDKGETVNFDNKNYMNLVRGGNLSEIYGAMNGAGKIYLINPNGVLFGASASVNTGSLVSSTRPLNEVDIAGFKEGADPLKNNASAFGGDITNMGQLRASSVKLEGNTVVLSNTANITTDGTVKLTDVTINAGKDINIGYVTGDKATAVNKSQYINPDKVNSGSSLGYKEYINGITVSDKTKYDYMLVHNVYELQNMQNNLNGNYMLANNIDACITRGWNFNQGFIPVGNTNKDIYEPAKDNKGGYAGKFNGLNYTIDKLSVTNRNAIYVGLFGYVTAEGNIKNVGLTNGVISGNKYTGGVVGLNYGVIENVYNTGIVSSSNALGGIAAWNFGTVKNSYNTGRLIANVYAGGIVGTNKGVIENVYNTSNISGSGYLGGVAGWNDGAIKNAKNTGKIKASFNWVGGITGMNKGTVEDAQNSGMITGDTRVGGIIGMNYGEVKNVNNSGNVNGKNFVGGISGYNLRGILKNSYNSGDIIGKKNVDGIVGSNFNGKLENNYNNGKVSGN